MSGYQRRLGYLVAVVATIGVLIALTGYGQPDGRRRALEGGFNFYLTKQVQWEALESISLRLPERRGMKELAMI